MDRRGFLVGATALSVAPFKASATESMRVAVISDLNGRYGSTQYGPEVHSAIDRILGVRPDVVLCTGDMVAGQRAKPKLTETELDAMWAAFHDVVTNPLTAAGIPMLVTPGNHDASAFPGFETERQAFERTWTGRSPAVQFIDAARYPFRYAASFSGVLFVGLDITTPGPLAPADMIWLAGVLATEVPRHNATLVFGHLPIWAITQGRETEIIGDTAFQTALASGGVGAYLSGHHHGYYPGRAGGLLQLAQACLGDGPRRLIGTSNRASKAMVMLEISNEGSIRQEALKPGAFVDKIDINALPASLVHGESRLDRSDLTG